MKLSRLLHHKCKECGAFEGHASWCPKEDPKIRAMHEQVMWQMKRVRKLEFWVQFWQGKFMTVKHENNQLRKKINSNYESER